MDVDWALAIREQELKLMTMPLSPHELYILSQLRRTIYTYSVMLGTLGLASGHAMSSTARPLSKLLTTGGFAAVGAFLGVALGMQRGLVKLDEMAAQGEGAVGLAKEWRRLDELKRRMRQTVNGVEASSMERIFRRRTG